MPDGRRPDPRVIGGALLASSAILLVLGFLVANGTVDVSADYRRTVTITLCGVSLVDALLALGFLLFTPS